MNEDTYTRDDLDNARDEFQRLLGEVDDSIAEIEGCVEDVEEALVGVGDAIDALADARRHLEGLRWNVAEGSSITDVLHKKLTGLGSLEGDLARVVRLTTVRNDDNPPTR
ncbi:MAG: hypothetical protein ACR2G9_02640 [Gaiellaceae bacterium]